MCQLESDASDLPVTAFALEQSSTMPISFDDANKALATLGAAKIFFRPIGEAEFRGLSRHGLLHQVDH